MTCSAVLRSQGMPYPRTCPRHGLFGTCPEPGPIVNRVTYKEIVITKDNLQEVADLSGLALGAIEIVYNTKREDGGPWVLVVAFDEEEDDANNSEQA